MPSSVVAAAALLLGSAAPTQAAGTSPSGSPVNLPVETVPCEIQPFSQPFLGVADSANYVLVHGEAPDAFEGAGWTLSGGAQVVKSTLADGAVGPVLQLPSGAKAVSPIFCVTTDYPTARMLVEDVVGAEGVSFEVSYEGTPSWTVPRNTGQVHGNGSQWTVSGKVNMQPERTEGWQRVRVTLEGKGNSSLFRVYDLYIDPYRR